MLTTSFRSKTIYIIINMIYAVHRERAQRARVYACQRTRRRCITMSLRYRDGRPPCRRCGTKCNMYTERTADTAAPNTYTHSTRCGQHYRCLIGTEKYTPAVSLHANETQLFASSTEIKYSRHGLYVCRSL